MDAMDKRGKREELLRWLQTGEPAFLAWYIGQYCHRHILLDLPLLLVDIEDLVHSPSFRYPHLEEVHLHLSLIYLELREHMEQEKELFLDFIRKKKGPLVRENKNRDSRPVTVNEILGLLEQEHILIREGWRKINQLCHHYQVPLQDSVLQEIYQRLSSCEKKILYCLQLEDRFMKSLKQKGEDEPDLFLF